MLLARKQEWEPCQERHTLDLRGKPLELGTQDTAGTWAFVGHQWVVHVSENHPTTQPPPHTSAR